MKAQFYAAGSFSEGLAPVQWKKNGTWGLIDRTGKTVVPERFAAIQPFSGGVAAARKAGTKERLWGCIDKTGRWVVEPQYRYVDRISEGLARFVEDGKHGFMDAKGNVVIQPGFHLAFAFKGGLARVETKEGAVGYVDTKGAYVRRPTK
jgi:hypothetical protein